MKRKPNKRKRPGRRRRPKDVEELHLFSIEITDDDDFNPHGFEITDEIADAVNKYREVCNDNPKQAVKELPDVIKQLPQVPQLRNHLFVALKRLGRYEEAYVVNDNAMRDFPDYIYATMNKAIQHWEKDELDEVEKVLGGMPLTINRSFPKRKVFHVSEVFAYESFMVRFWLSKDSLEGAESHFHLLKELAPNHPMLPELKRQIEMHSLKGMFSGLTKLMNRPRGRGKK
ncbi:MAG: hypothetical protein AAFZ15_13800 [Bacteroidota bacterium]